jgi:hypothetical protein
MGLNSNRGNHFTEAAPHRGAKCRDSRGRGRYRNRPESILKEKQHSVLDADPDTDSDPEGLSRCVAESSLRHGSLELLSLSGSDGRKPWV